MLMCPPPPAELRNDAVSASFFPIDYSQDDDEAAPCSLFHLMGGEEQEDRKPSSFTIKDDITTATTRTPGAPAPSASAPTFPNEMMLALLQQSKQQLLREDGQGSDLFGDSSMELLETNEQDRLFPGGVAATGGAPATAANAQQLQQLAALLNLQQPQPQQQNTNTKTSTNSTNNQPTATVLDSTTIFLSPPGAGGNPPLQQQQHPQPQQQPSLLAALAAFTRQHQHYELPASAATAVAKDTAAQQQQQQQQQPSQTTPLLAPQFPQRTTSDTTGTITANTSATTTTATRTKQSLRRMSTGSSTSTTSSSCFMGFGGPVRQLRRAQSLRRSNSNSSSKGSNKRFRLLDGNAKDASSSSDDNHKAALGREMNKALLHHSCRLFANELDVIECALQFDSDAIRQPEPTECHYYHHHHHRHRAAGSQQNLLVPQPRLEVAGAADGGDGEDNSVCSSRLTSNTGGDNSNSNSNSNSNNNNNNNNDVMSDSSQREHRNVGSGCSGVVETYNYAINVALKNNASPKVVELLAQKAPDVLLLPDGPEECGSLSIFLSHCQYTDRPVEDNARIVASLLRAQRAAATVLDRHQNAPLHHAVRAARRLPLEALSLVHAAHPAALTQRNFHGQMPVDVAVTCPGTVPIAATDLLQKLLYAQLESESVRTMNWVDRDLDRSLARQEQAAMAMASESGSGIGSRTTSPTLSSSTSNYNHSGHDSGGSFFF